jgi:hypothetical protein
MSPGAVIAEVARRHDVQTEVSEALCIASSWPADLRCQRADAASRSPNSIANWFSAAVHSRVDRFQPFLTLRSARYSNLVCVYRLLDSAILMVKACPYRKRHPRWIRGRDGLG